MEGDAIEAKIRNGERIANIRVVRPWYVGSLIRSRRLALVYNIDLQLPIDLGRNCLWTLLDCRLTAGCIDHEHLLANEFRIEEEMC